MSADALGRPESRERGEPAADRAVESVANGFSSLPRMVAPEDAPLVPEGAVFEGEVVVLGDTRIEGRVEGSLRGAGRVEIGPRAQIFGPLDCDEVDSQGSIQGPIVARVRVRLRSGARLRGDLTAPLVEVCEDALWTGRARVGSGSSGDSGQT